MRALCKLRLIVHLLHGMAIIALQFGTASPARRQELTRRWTLKMLALVACAWSCITTRRGSMRGRW